MVLYETLMVKKCSLMKETQSVNNAAFILQRLSGIIYIYRF